MLRPEFRVSVSGSAPPGGLHILVKLATDRAVLEPLDLLSCDVEPPEDVDRFNETQLTVAVPGSSGEVATRQPSLEGEQIRGISWIAWRCEAFLGHARSKA